VTGSLTGPAGFTVATARQLGGLEPDGHVTQMKKRVVGLWGEFPTWLTENLLDCVTPKILSCRSSEVGRKHNRHERVFKCTSMPKLGSDTAHTTFLSAVT
jgi:hypothetical protein